MANKKKKKSTRKKKNNQRSYGQIVFALVLIVIAIFGGIVNQGTLGHMLNGILVLLFGNLYFYASIFLIIIGVLLLINKTNLLFSNKYGRGLSIIILATLMLFSYFGFSLVTSDLLQLSTYINQLKDGDIYATGLIGYGLSLPFVYLIGSMGYLIVIIIIYLIGIISIFDLSTIIDKFKAMYQKRKIKKMEKKAIKKEQEKLEREARLEELAKQANAELEQEDSKEVSDDNSSSDIDDLFNEFDPNYKQEGENQEIASNDVNNEITTPSSDTINLEPLSGSTSLGDETIDVNVMPSTLEKQEIKNKSIGQYHVPSLNLLNDYDNVADSLNTLEQIAKEKAKILIETLETFNLHAKISNISVGPSITKYEIIPETGVKVSRFNNLHNDLAFALAAKNVRIEAPIPGKSAIGIEIPNETNMMVGLKEVLASKNNDMEKKLQIGLGKDIYGNAMFCEIDKTPHLLIAGSTGSGKSVCVNSIIVSILTKASPNEVKLVMIDPKKVELTPYNGIPHLLAPVVTEAKKASIVLQKMVKEMERRYELFSETNTRNISGYNAKIKDEELKLPYIVVIVDELADLMMVASKEVETSIARLAQMARAAGIHLIIATQRPSTDVITGLIKANIPSRIAFAVSSGIDSRTILDQTGAEQLLGKGDMLLSQQSTIGLERIQGAFLSDEEIIKVVDFIKDQVDEETLEASYDQSLVNIDVNNDFDEELDPLYEEIEKYVIQTQKASASMFQRQYKIGYNRALRILDQLEANGIISANEGTKPRRVLVGEGNESY